MVNRKIKPLKYKPGSEKAPQKPDYILNFIVSDADEQAVTPQPAEEAEKETAEKTSGATLLPMLLHLCADRKRTTVKDWLRLGQIMLNGAVVTQFNLPVRSGDRIDINTSRQWQIFHNPRLKIVYEDDDIIVVEKGYGLLSMGNDRVKTGTAYSLLKDYVKRKDPRNKIFIVHRLDQHTSGLMMFAKTEEAKTAMQHNWNNMVIDRRYAAIVEGRPEEQEGEVRSLLAENTEHVMYVTDDPEKGKLAVTRWRAVRSRNGYTLLEVSLDTGRKNQIRAHMSQMGHPIAGDRKYGATGSPIQRLALHAQTLRFVHPITRRDMNFTSPLPASFGRLV